MEFLTIIGGIKMRKIHLVFLLLISVFSMPSVFAEEQNNRSLADTKPCATIAHACVAAGFSERKTADKQFWQNCMRPILLGQTVQNVTVDSATVKACRANKIDSLKKELIALEKASAEKSS
jgi:hypothetical protein